jgi:hypothetical protein
MNLDRSAAVRRRSAVLTHPLTERRVTQFTDVVSTPPSVSVKPGQAHDAVAPSACGGHFGGNYRLWSERYWPRISWPTSRCHHAAYGRTSRVLV